MLASTLIDLNSEEVEALHVANVVFQLSQLLLDVFSASEEVDLFVLRNSSNLNGLTLTLSLELGSIFFKITLRKLEIVLNSVSLNFIIENFCGLIKAVNCL